MRARLLGVELYFDRLEPAKEFYQNELGLELRDEARGEFAQFSCGEPFVCLERKGSERYPSADKAVLFLEVRDVDAVIERVGREKVVQEETDESGRPHWAVVHDPEGHNILLLRARA